MSEHQYYIITFFLPVVSRNRQIYICLSSSIPVNFAGCLKRFLGLLDGSAHTVTKHDGGMGRSSDPNKSASLFVICLEVINNCQVRRQDYNNYESISSFHSDICNSLLKIHKNNYGCCYYIIYIFIIVCDQLL